MGVAGVSRDAGWRRRAIDPAPRETRPAPAVKETVPTDSESLVQIARSSSEALAAIRVDLGEDCSRCKLHTLGRKQIVFGVGNPDADLMFVGEAPGADRKSVV